jgi:hypothetical protein
VKRLLLVLVFVAMSAWTACDTAHVPETKSANRVVTTTRVNEQYMFIFERTTTHKCYMGIYNVGLVEIPTSECQ